MNLSRWTRETKLFAAAIANVVFMASSFMKWFGMSESSLVVEAKPDETISAFWVYLLIAAVAALLFLASAFRFELPGRIEPLRWGIYLTSLVFVLAATNFLAPFSGLGREPGLVIAFLASAVALGASLWAKHDER